MKYTYNPALSTCKPGWPGTPQDGKGRFMNADHPFVPALPKVLKWILTPNPQKAEKSNDPFRLQHRDDTSFLHNGQDCIVWLGHATFFIRVAGISMLTDPVFYRERWLKRYADHAFGPDPFKHLDYLLLSHDHRDHCQEKSIKKLVSLNPGMQVLTGLNMEKLLKKWCPAIDMQCAGWYQQYKTAPDIEIFYLPTRHWCRRGLTDTNLRLWGAFVIRAGGRTIYFGGDTAYDRHFVDVRDLFDPIDVAILGVGAYKPAWFMQSYHISPQDAVRGFHETGARVLIPMHYGTFDLSDEPPGEPYRILEAEQASGKIRGSLQLLQLGENFLLK